VRRVQVPKLRVTPSVRELLQRTAQPLKGPEVPDSIREWGVHVLWPRSHEKLRQLADELKARHGISAKVVAKDLSRATAPEEIYQELRQDATTIEVLVNNAGFGTNGPFAEADLKTELEMMQVNMTSLTHLTKLFLDDMLQRGGGKILNVASTAAFQPGPLMAVYYATKAYVLSFTEALATELRGSGVTVTCLCPGPTQTGFQTRADMKDVRLVSGAMMTARSVAVAGYRGLMRNKAVVIPGLQNKMLAQSVRVSPRSVVTRFVKWLNQRVRKNQTDTGAH